MLTAFDHAIIDYAQEIGVDSAAVYQAVYEELDSRGLRIDRSQPESRWHNTCMHSLQIVKRLGHLKPKA
jgi:hypothetical protein